MAVRNEIRPACEAVKGDMRCLLSGANAHTIYFASFVFDWRSPKKFS